MDGISFRSVALSISALLAAVVVLSGGRYFFTSEPQWALGIVLGWLCLWVTYRDKEWVWNSIFTLWVCVWILGLVTLDVPARFPLDVWWWEGVVAENKVAIDGDQDVLTIDRHWLVTDWGPVLKPGDRFYLLHARNKSGQERTFYCTEHRREACGHLSLAVRPPRETVTWSQGQVAASKQTIQP